MLSKIHHVTSLLLFTAPALVAACDDPDQLSEGPNELSVEDLDALDPDEQGARTVLEDLQLVDGGDEVDEQAFSKHDLEDAVIGESADGPLAAGDCVYVQWCDQPGPNGTICRYRPGCVPTKAPKQECIDDTYYVCGSPVYPWILIY